MILNELTELREVGVADPAGGQRPTEPPQGLASGRMPQDNAVGTIKLDDGDDDDNDNDDPYHHHHHHHHNHNHIINDAAHNNNNYDNGNNNNNNCNDNNNKAHKSSRRNKRDSFVGKNSLTNFWSRLLGTLSMRANATATGASSSQPCQRSSGRAATTAAPPSTTNHFLLQAGYDVVKKIGGGSYSQVKEVRQGYDRYAVKAGEKVFIVMEIADGGDLLDYVRRKGHLSENRARLFFAQLLDALFYLHKLDIAHRDLKCENVLLKSSSRVKLADFGFSRLCSRDGRRVLSQTFCGSTLYASPEVLQGQLYNPKLYDVWSLGCILFIMLFGIVPFDDDDVKKQIKQQLNREIRFPSTLYVASEARELIRSMLEPDILSRKSVIRLVSHPWLTSGKSDGDQKRDGAAQIS